MAAAALMLMVSSGSAEAPGSEDQGGCRQGCVHPKFQGRSLYLPFCLSGQTYGNYCDALCASASSEQRPTKGSCEGCEARCNQIFAPVCSEDQEVVFPNTCLAKCSGIEHQECKGLYLPSVIPGKSPLPINRASVEELQNLDQ